jgi:hypothetical protein
MNPRIRTCYISAPAGTNLDVLRGALQRRGVDVAVPELVVGSDWSAEISATLGKVDLVIGVLTRERRSNWVLFEMGLASAKGCPIVLFVPPKESGFPPDLQRFLVVRASMGNAEAIGFALDQVLAAPHQAVRPKAVPPVEGSGLGRGANELLQSAKVAIDANKPEELVQIAARALRQSGVDVVTERPGDPTRADIAIWSDVLQPSLGNPVLVEVKLRIGTRDAGRKVLQQLSSALASSGTRWGLLLYGESPIPEEKLWTAVPPNVLVLSISTLLRRLGHEPFANVIWDLRNRRVHGEKP